MKKIESSLIYLSTVMVDIIEAMLTSEVSIANFAATVARGDVRFTDNTDTAVIGGVFRRLEVLGLVKRRDSRWHQYYDFCDRNRAQKIFQLLEGAGFFGTNPEEFNMLSYGSVFMDKVAPENIPTSTWTDGFVHTCRGPGWHRFLRSDYVNSYTLQKKGHVVTESLVCLTDTFCDVVSDWEYISELIRHSGKPA